jgi:glycogen operon protein
MIDEAWNAHVGKSLGMLLAGDAIEETDERGETTAGDSLLVLLNAHDERVQFTLPALDAASQWHRIFDTADPDTAERAFKPGGRYPLQGQSLALFKVTPLRRERRRTLKAERAVQPEATPEPEPVSVEG